MSKLSYEDKINLYNERKQGVTLSTLSKKYNKRMSGITYLVKLIEIHGLEVLKTTKNKSYPEYFKHEAIDRALINNEAVIAVSLDIGLSSDGMLQNWIKKYKENGYNIVERKRGRSPTMIKKPRKNKTETTEETIKRLENENEYLKAELEYSKKLRAVVQQRKNQQQKKK